MIKKLISWCHAMCHRTQITVIIKDNLSSANEWTKAQIDSMKQSAQEPYEFMNKKEKRNSIIEKMFILILIGFKIYSNE